jgi:aspergillopepsin I
LILTLPQVGSYDFGFIDEKKYQGEMIWVNVKQKDGFWDFPMTGFAIGSGPVQELKWDSIADTGYVLF